MNKSVFLDSRPVGLITQRPGKSPEADTCRQWYADVNANGWDVYLPEIVDYEVRRELTRSGRAASLNRLDLLVTTAIYLPITTVAMRRASELWAQARTEGWATADPHALDGDVILAAQALTLLPRPEGLVVATGNVAHLARYLSVQEWTTITP